MSRERELLKRATEALKYWMDTTSHSVDWELLEDLESYLSTPEPTQDEPVDISDKSEPTIVAMLPNGVAVSNVYEAYEAGLKEVRLQDEEPTLLTKEELGAIMLDWMHTPKSRASDLYRSVQKEVLKKNGCPAPRPEFVRLSEEEVSEILSSTHTPYEAICATENMLVRKNTINKSDPDSIDLQSRCRGDKL